MAALKSYHIKIGDRLVGPAEPPFFLAEIGINHNGDRGLALEMLAAAQGCGADAVKFQAFTPERLFNPTVNPAAVELFRQWALTREDFAALKAAADRSGLPFLCTPFDPEWVRFLNEELEVAAFKIASSDCTNLPLLEAIGATGKPAILSTGMATLEEVRLGVDTLLGAGCPGLILLHCVTQYPPKPDEINLRAIDTLRDSFDFPIGFSDHWVGPLAALGAIARGACLIEKHFTTDRSLPGPDQEGSADPQMLAALIEQGRALWAMRGDGVKEAKGGEVPLRTGGRPGLYAVRDLPAGHVVQPEDLYAARPQGATPARDWHAVVGSPLAEAVEAHGSVGVGVAVPTH